MTWGKFGKVPFGKGKYGWGVPIGVAAGAYGGVIGPGYATFPPYGFI